MKMPRVHDFDPNAKLTELDSPLDNLPTIRPPIKKSAIPSLQQEIDKATHTTELHEQSAYFKPLEKTELPNERTPERSNVRRTHRRASYELYTDQIEAIQRIALEDKLQGGTGNQSEMVRTAIDEYLKKKR